MVKRKRKAKKKSKRSGSKEPKRTRIDVLKERLNDMAIDIREDLEQIKRNSGLDDQRLELFLKNNGYDGLKKLPNLQISEPILDQMITKFKKYDHLQRLISRYKTAQNKLIDRELEKETQKLEEQVAQMEEQDKFYTELPDKQGFVQMKQKYFAEKQQWELQKATAEEILEQNPEEPNALALLEEAKRELKILSKKRSWARAKNVQPNIVKWTGKVTKAINTVQDSVGEITKPFAEMGEMSGYNKKNQPKTDYEAMFSPEKIFDTKKKGKSIEESFGSGF